MQDSIENMQLFTEEEEGRLRISGASCFMISEQKFLSTFSPFGQFGV